MCSKLQTLINFAFKTFYSTSNTANAARSLTPNLVSYNELIKHFSQVDLSDEINLNFITEAKKLVNEYKNNYTDRKKPFNEFMNEKKVNYHPDEYKNILTYIFSDAPVLHMEICEKESFYSLVLFLVRRGKKIPFHNHPCMFGFLKLLRGNASVTALTPVEEIKSGLIKVKHDFTKSISSLDSSTNFLTLEPNLHNIHEISASNESDLVVVDLIIPPYEESNCKYYEISNDLKSNDKNFIYLKELDYSPPSYYCDSLIFMGPQIE